MKNLEKYESFKDLKNSKSKDKKKTPDENLIDFYKQLQEANKKPNKKSDENICFHT
jgi:hypothetical protein